LEVFGGEAEVGSGFSGFGGGFWVSIHAPRYVYMRRPRRRESSLW
jgi:hypothetical protein